MCHPCVWLCAPWDARTEGGACGPAPGSPRVLHCPLILHLPRVSECAQRLAQSSMPHIAAAADALAVPGCWFAREAACVSRLHDAVGRWTRKAAHVRRQSLTLTVCNPETLQGRAGQWALSNLVRGTDVASMLCASCLGAEALVHVRACVCLCPLWVSLSVWAGCADGWPLGRRVVYQVGRYACGVARRSYGMVVCGSGTEVVWDGMHAGVARRSSGTVTWGCMRSGTKVVWDMRRRQVGGGTGHAS